MDKKNETAVCTVSEKNYISNIAQYFQSSNTYEQKNLSRGSLLSGSRDLHLTYTDKSPSTPVKNTQNFKENSMQLYLNTMKLYRTNKKVLQQFHRRGFQKIKYINKDNIVLYSPSNPAGNSNAGWKLAQEMSNTDKARLASKQNAYEKALANVDIWEYFATFTLDRKKQDRYNFKKALTHITKFLQYRHILYFMVGERHKDGAWHFHALLSAEISPYLAEFEGKALKNWYISKSLHEGKEIRHCRPYTEFFGYNTIEPCRNKEACIHYMTKYVLKTFDDPNFERVSRRRYFTSKGLKTPFIIMPSNIDLEDFEIAMLSQYTQKVYLKRQVVPNWVYEPIDHSNSNPPPPL